MENNKYCQECWEMETVVHGCWECKWCSCCEKQFDAPQKVKQGIITIVVVQSLSRVQLFAAPWTAARQASLSSWSLLRLMSIESVMPSNHLILCHPLLLPSVFPSIRVFSNESILRIRWPKYWTFSLSISPSIEYSGQRSFMIDWFDLLAVQGTLKSLLQHQQFKSIDSSVLSFLYSPTLTSMLLSHFSRVRLCVTP